MKKLTVYYSYGGNTKSIAEKIHKQVGGAIVSIQTAFPYTGSYDEIVDQGQKEIENGFMPEIKPLAENPEDYDTIILGTPVWWYTFAPAVKTFLHDYRLSGKTIYPFATNGGWIGHTFKDLEKVCKGAKVEEGLNIMFDEKVLRTPPVEIDRWIQNIN